MHRKEIWAFYLSSNRSFSVNYYLRFENNIRRCLQVIFDERKNIQTAWAYNNVEWKKVQSVETVTLKLTVETNWKKKKKKKMMTGQAENVVDNIQLSLYSFILMGSLACMSHFFWIARDHKRATSTTLSPTLYSFILMGSSACMSHFFWVARDTSVRRARRFPFFYPRLALLFHAARKKNASPGSIRLNKKGSHLRLGFGLTFSG